MIMQYTAAALATESKVLSHPASVDSIPTSANVEDHVSMGATAAIKARRINTNVERILAIELMSAAQGIDFRREIVGAEAQLGRGTQPVYDLIRQYVPFIEKDTILYKYMETVYQMVLSGKIDSVSRAAMGTASS
jgi:histidine ammonia-lyase